MLRILITAFCRLKIKKKKKDAAYSVLARNVKFTVYLVWNILEIKEL